LLRDTNQLGTLAYIEWGEEQEYKDGIQRGMKWPNGPWVKNRVPGWYSLPKSETHVSQIFFSKAFGSRHITKYSQQLLIADCRLYFLDLKEGVDSGIMAAVLNSSLSNLFTEIVGRVTLGDGALELAVEDARDYLLVANPNKFDETSQQAIHDAFQPLLQRSIGSVFEEIQRPDRNALDRAVLSAIGLNPDEWLPRLYEGLSLLVRERTELGKKRGQLRSSRGQKAAGRVSVDVLHDLLPNGPQRFPDDFLTPAGRISQHEIQLPEKHLQHRGAFFGREELSDESGKKIILNNMFEVRYVLYAQANGVRVAHIPDKMVEVTRTVNEYSKYLRELRTRLYEAFFRQTLDQVAANRFVDDTWRKLKLPMVEE
jgi:hypothetical protein